MTIQLNRAGLARARSLIAAGKVDKTASWSFDDAVDGDALLGDDKDWKAYGGAHLGVDPEASEETKGRFRYPVEKAGKLYRSGVIAAKQRAGAQHDAAIESAAGDLLDRIDNGDDKNAAPGSHERRAAAPAPEVREGKIVGYAALFNRPTAIGRYFREQIAPGAFAAAIGGDVRALFNHDANYVLGRTASGTLALSEDDRGLRYEVTPPDAGWANDLMTSIERGDISGSSFAFDPIVQEWDESEDLPLRTLRQVNLYDVSPVTFPAYEDTSCAVRSLEAWRAERRAPFNPFPFRARLLKAQLERRLRA